MSTEKRAFSVSWASWNRQKCPEIVLKFSKNLVLKFHFLLLGALWPVYDIFVAISWHWLFCPCILCGSFSFIQFCWCPMWKYSWLLELLMSRGGDWPQVWLLPLQLNITRAVLSLQAVKQENGSVVKSTDCHLDILGIICPLQPELLPMTIRYIKIIQ